MENRSDPLSPSRAIQGLGMERVRSESHLPRSGCLGLSSFMMETYSSVTFPAQGYAGMTTSLSSYSSTSIRCVCNYPQRNLGQPCPALEDRVPTWRKCGGQNPETCGL